MAPQLGGGSGGSKVMHKLRLTSSALPPTFVRGTFFLAHFPTNQHARMRIPNPESRSRVHRREGGYG